VHDYAFAFALGGWMPLADEDFDCIRGFASMFGGFIWFPSLFRYSEERRTLLVIFHLTSQQGRWHFNKRNLLAHRFGCS
jgi:hypothetical protein